MSSDFILGLWQGLLAGVMILFTGGVIFWNLTQPK